MTNSVFQMVLTRYRGTERRALKDRRVSDQSYTGVDRRSGYDRRTRVRIPIFVKLSILSVLQILLIVSIISVTMLIKQKRQFTEQLISFGMSVVKIIAHNSADKLLGEEDVALFQLLKDIAENERVRYAMILDNHQKIVAHSIFDKANTVYHPPPHLTAIDERDGVTISGFTDNKEALLLFQSPITYQKIKVGEVILVVSRQAIYDTLRDATYFILILTVFILCIGVVSSLFVSFYFSKPIVGLKTGAKILGEGDFSYRVDIHRNDEFGELAMAFNQMAIGLGERERIRETFGKYVAPAIRDRILSGTIPLDGERREATLLFSDLRGFTPYVEKHAPEEVIKGMRSYFSAMQRAISRHGGLVLQYIGDEIEAVFGVPIADEDHAEKALKAAIDMRKELEALNHDREAAGLKPFHHGIGLYTGVVLAGNTGSDDRLSYTLIGDTVNLASRIQGMTKEVGWDILAARETIKRIHHPFELIEEAPRKPKGYSKEIRVYRVIRDLEPVEEGGE
jgi:adenylate cyclase